CAPFTRGAEVLTRRCMTRSPASAGSHPAGSRLWAKAETPVSARTKNANLNMATPTQHRPVLLRRPPALSCYDNKPAPAGTPHSGLATENAVHRIGGLPDQRLRIMRVRME